MYQRNFRVIPLVGLLLFTVFALGEGTKIVAPKNKYQPADDVKLGREAAAQVAKEMHLFPEDGQLDTYVKRVGQGIVAAIPAEFSHPEFEYTFRVVDAKEINAFALPGGPMFVNSGMIAAAATEGEMAGVMAHEISHVALRHGTAQATKADNPGLQIGKIGGSVLGSILGGNIGSIVQQGTQFGLGTYMLKFSREYETQADVLGAQIMARAGYDPMDLARMFKTIEAQGGSNGPQWLSDHPNPGNRYERIQQEAQMLTVAHTARDQTTQFEAAKASLTGGAHGAAPSKAAGAPNTPPSHNVPPPSETYRTFQANNLFAIAVPDNWKESVSGSSVTFAPEGASGEHQGQPVFTHGAIVGVGKAAGGDLKQSSDQLVSGILKSNAYLKPQGDYQKERLGDHDALGRRFSGVSPATNKPESVNAYAALMGNGQLLYVIEVVPEDEQEGYRRAFEEMRKSVTFANP